MILQDFYLCNWTDAQALCAADADVFVVNCTKDLPMVSARGIRVAVDDNGASDDAMFAAMERVVSTIHDELILKNSVVIVHCLAGRQRSATVIACYLMWWTACSVEEAIEYIRLRKRDAFFASVNFQDTLKRWDSALQCTRPGC